VTGNNNISTKTTTIEERQNMPLLSFECPSYPNNFFFLLILAMEEQLPQQLPQQGH
jgi:hypothetical protein